jgi:hypothetical protein
MAPMSMWVFRVVDEPWRVVGACPETPKTGRGDDEGVVCRPRQVAYGQDIEKEELTSDHARLSPSAESGSFRKREVIASRHGKNCSTRSSRLRESSDMS